MSEEQLKKLNAHLSETESLLEQADHFALWTDLRSMGGTNFTEQRKNYKKYLETPESQENGQESWRVLECNLNSNQKARTTN